MLYIVFFISAASVIVFWLENWVFLMLMCWLYVGRVCWWMLFEMIGKRIFVVLFNGELISIFCGLNKFIMMVRMRLICAFILVMMFFVSRLLCNVVWYNEFMVNGCLCNIEFMDWLRCSCVSLRILFMLVMVLRQLWFL